MRGRADANLEQKRILVIPVLFDLLAISFIVATTGGLARGWFVLCFFPALSASSYLGPSWTIGTAETQGLKQLKTPVDSDALEAILLGCVEKESYE